MDSAAGGSLGSASGEITLSADGAIRALNQVSNGLKNLNSQSQAQSGGLLSWASRNEQALNTVGAGMLGVGAAFLGAFGLATKTAMDFDAQISAVGSVAGATQEQVGALREEALRLGADTTFSASEAASAMEIMLKAGAPLESVLNGATEAVLNLSAATGADVPLSAETAATAMNVFGVSAEEAADTIAQSANASSLDVNDWALALKSVGPVAASLGMGMDDLAAAMVILGDAGIKGEVGATALRNILLGIADPAGAGAVALNEWGIATHDASGNMRSLEDITHDLAGSWGDMSQAQQIALAEQIAGKDGVAAFMAIMDAQTEAVKNNSDAFDDASTRMDATGTASEQAQARMDNLKGSFEQLKGTLETLAITFVSGLAPAMRKVVDGANKLLQKVLDLPGPVKTVLAALTGIIGVLGTLGGGFLLMLPRIAATQAALASLGGVSGILGAIMGALLSPVVLITAALVALALVFKDDIIAAVESAVKWFKDFVDTSAHVQNMVDDLRSAFDAFKAGDYGKAFELVGRAAGQLWEAIKEAVAEIDWGAVGATLLDGLMGLASFVAGIVLDLGSIAVSVAGWLWNQAVDLWTGLKNWAIGLVPEGDPVNIGTIAAGIAGWAFSAAQDIWEALTGWLFGGTFGDGTGGATAGKVGQVSLGEVAANIANWAFTSMVDLWTTLRDWVMGQITGKDWSAVGTEVASGLRNAIRDGIQNAADLFAILLSWVSDQIRGVDWNSVGSTFAELLVGGIKGIVGLVGLAGWLLGQILLAIVDVDWSSVGSAFLTFFQSAITALVGFLTGFATTLYNEITTQLGEVDWGGIGSDIEGYFVDAVSGVGTAIGEAIWGELPGWLQDLISGTADFLGGDASTQGGGGGTNIGTAPGGGTGATGGPMRFGDLGGKGYANVADDLNRLASAARDAGTAVAAFATNAATSFSNTGKAAQAGLQPIPPLAGQVAATLLATAVPAFIQLAATGVAQFTSLQSAAQGRFTAMQGVILSTTAAAASGARGQIAGMALSVIGQVGSMAGTVQGRMSAMQGSVTGSVNAMAGAASSAASRMASSLSSGANQAVGAVSGALARIPGIIAGIGGSAAATAYSVGANISNSFASGMYSALGAIQAAAAQMVAAADAAIRARARIASPSKVFAALGAYLGEGFESGIRSMIPDVRRAAYALVSVPGLSGNTYGASVPAYAYASPQVSGSSYSDNRVIHVTVPDAGNPQATARAVVSMLESDYERVGRIRA